MATAPATKKMRHDGAMAALKPLEQHREHPAANEVMHNARSSLQNTFVPSAHNGRIDPKVQQAQRFAEQQAHRDGCTGMFKTFDSYFGNFLIPVIPTLSDL